MPTIRNKSSLLKSTIFTLLALFGVAAALPTAGLAAPSEPPQLSFEPSSYDFGLQPLNWGSTQTNIQLRNVGPEPVQTGPLSVESAGSSAFWTGNSDCNWRTLQPNETCFAQVYFGPQDAIPYAAELRISADGYTFSAGLSGVGGRANFTPAQNPTDFGVAAVGSAGTTREIAVTNTGNMAGGAFIAVVSGGAVGSFQLLDESCTGQELQPAATCTVQVRFRPVSEGVKRATLSLFGDSDGGTQLILTGMGSAPEALEPAIDGQLPAAEVAGIRRSGHGKRRQHGRNGRRGLRRAALADARVSKMP